MRALVATAFVATLLAIVFTGPAATAGGPVQYEREYMIGGSMGGVTYECLPQGPFDIGAACDIPCPGGTCDITVVDKHNAHVAFRVCFDGESFCRPEGYLDTASVPGTHVTVAPATTGSTTGTVTVR